MEDTERSEEGLLREQKQTEMEKRNDELKISEGQLK